MESGIHAGAALGRTGIVGEGSGTSWPYSCGDSPGCRRFVDLTCGLGIDCRAIVEALDAGIEGPESRVEAFAIEMSPLLALTAAFNFDEAGVENIDVVEAECRSWLEDYIGEPFGLAFIDPARRGADGARVYNIHDCSPDVATMGELLPARRRWLWPSCRRCSILRRRFATFRPPFRYM